MIGEVLLRKSPLTREEWLSLIGEVEEAVRRFLEGDYLKRLDDFGAGARSGDFPRGEDELIDECLNEGVEVSFLGRLDLSTPGAWIDCGSLPADMDDPKKVYTKYFCGLTILGWALVKVECGGKAGLRFGTSKVSGKMTTPRGIVEIGIHPKYLLTCLTAYLARVQESLLDQKLQLGRALNELRILNYLEKIDQEVVS